MKNKLLLAGLILVAAAILVKAGMVLAYGGTITEVCKGNGGILMARENCPSNAEKWLIGGGNSSGMSNNYIGIGNVAFINQGLFLNKDGTVWSYEQKWDGNQALDEYGLVEKTELKVPVLVDTIIQWDGESFLTQNGDYYKFIQYVGWKNINISATPTL